MLKLWYASNRREEVCYFADVHDEGDFTFTEPKLDEIKQNFYLSTLGHRPGRVKDTNVSDMVWNNPDVVKYLLNTSELMVVQLKYLSGVNSVLGDVTHAWELGGKITLPNPFRLEDN